MRPNIIFITPCVNEDFFIPVRKGACDAAGMLGADVEFCGTADVDIDELIKLAEKAIADQVDGIALSLCHESAFNEVVDRALKHGIPVLSFNIDTKDPTNRRLAGVAQNMFAAGKIVGQRAAQFIREGSEVLFTLHSQGISALDERLRGELEAIGPKKITYDTVITGMTAQLAADIISERLHGDSAIGAVICTGQADTEGAGIAKSRLLRERSLYVAGFDVSQGILAFIQDGIIDFTIDQQPYVQGFYTVAQLVLNIRYGIKPFDIDTGAAVIDKHNADQVIRAQSLGYR